MLYFINIDNNKNIQIFNLISAIFKDYPDIVEWLNKVIQTSKNLVSLEDFYKNILNINNQMLNWVITEEHEGYIITSIRDLLKNYEWKYKRKVGIIKNRASENNSKGQEIKNLNNLIDNFI
ncbi:MAG: hypothetical protein ACD_4C00358G0003 [uncultured bacterium (gcode 4)]|uniref:Uncharacterized protein n=1 Tax=uncultured bacterium (gcode 4) TaxID=1234023 RepID=K2GSG3_9BACT|nr:MAG: hypothetical protein ACD_4C00358G0003 [uncultured bacterium (gcode 4)]